jgi:hypothetical protein
MKLAADTCTWSHSTAAGTLPVVFIHSQDSSGGHAGSRQNDDNRSREFELEARRQPS